MSRAESLGELRIYFETLGEVSCKSGGRERSKWNIMCDGGQRYFYGSPANFQKSNRTSGIGPVNLARASTRLKTQKSSPGADADDSLSRNLQALLGMNLRHVIHP